MATERVARTAVEHLELRSRMIADTAWVARIVEAGHTVTAELEDKHLVVAPGSRIVADHTVISAGHIVAVA